MAQQTAALTFKKATRSQSYLKLAIEGPSGSGKTWTALSIGQYIAEKCGSELALIDTENGSASLYAGDFDFSVLELSDNYHPARYIKAIQAAEDAGIKVLIVDSITHEWTGPGGILDMLDKAKQAKGGNEYALWSKFTPMHNEFIQALVKSKLHLIVTIRSKQDYLQEKDPSTGKLKITKAGMAPMQREGLDYEFSVILDMNQENTGIVTKTRCSALTGGVYQKPGASVAAILWNWLQSGEPQKQELEQPSRIIEGVITPDNVTPIRTPTADKEAITAVQFESEIKSLFKGLAPNEVCKVMGIGSFSSEIKARYPEQKKQSMQFTLALRLAKDWIAENPYWEDSLADDRNDQELAGQSYEEEEGGDTPF